MDTYSYVNGDPINLIDPTGHVPCEDGVCGSIQFLESPAGQAAVNAQAQGEQQALAQQVQQAQQARSKYPGSQIINRNQQIQLADGGIVDVSTALSAAQAATAGNDGTLPSRFIVQTKVIDLDGTQVLAVLDNSGGIYLLADANGSTGTYSNYSINQIGVIVSNPDDCNAPGQYQNGVCYLPPPPAPTPVPIAPGAAPVGQWGSDSGAWVYQTEANSPPPQSGNFCQDIACQVASALFGSPPTPAGAAQFAGGQILGVFLPDLLGTGLAVTSFFGAAASAFDMSSNPTQGQSGIPQASANMVEPAGIPCADGGQLFHDC